MPQTTAFAANVRERAGGGKARRALRSRSAKRLHCAVDATTSSRLSLRPVAPWLWSPRSSGMRIKYPLFTVEANTITNFTLHMDNALRLMWVGPGGNGANECNVGDGLARCPGIAGMANAGAERGDQSAPQRCPRRVVSRAARLLRLGTNSSHRVRPTSSRQRPMSRARRWRRDGQTPMICARIPLAARALRTR